MKFILSICFIYYLNKIKPLPCKEVHLLLRKPQSCLKLCAKKIREKHYSIRTETQYLQWVKRYILSVSYTHLDVYKRQQGDGNCSSMAATCLAEGGFGPRTTALTMVSPGTFSKRTPDT